MIKPLHFVRSVRVRRDLSHKKQISGPTTSNVRVAGVQSLLVRVQTCVCTATASRILTNSTHSYSLTYIGEPVRLELELSVSAHYVPMTKYSPITYYFSAI